MDEETGQSRPMTLPLRNRDDRIEQMLADPDAYFAAARKRAEAAIAAEDQARAERELEALMHTLSAPWRTLRRAVAKLRVKGTRVSADE